MKKRFLSLLCAVMVLTMSTVSASAEAPDDPLNTPSFSATSDAEKDEDVSVSVSEGVIGFKSSAPTEVKQEEKDDGTTVAATGVYPFEVKYETHNGAPIIIKSFRIPPGSDPMSLVEDDFKEDGYIYSKKDILVNEPEVVTNGKTVAEPIVFATEDKEQSTLLAALAPVIEYNEGGYTGQLTLDYASIVSTATDTKNYSYPIKKTIQVDNLADNDFAYLDKKMGNLTLEGAEWDLNDGVQRAANIIPGTYTANATYTGIGYGSKVMGYTNTAYYSGYVTRTSESTTVCSVVYKGMKDPATVSNIPWTGIFIVLAVLLIVGGLLALIFLKGFPTIKFPGNRRRNVATPPVEVPD